MSKALRLAVFDWNGTLLDDVDAWVEGCNAALSVFDHAPRNLDAWRELYTCPIIHSYEKAGVPVDEYLAKSDQANEAFYAAYQAEINKGMRLRKSAHEVLEHLTKHEYHLTILSNHRADLLMDEIRQTGLDTYFQHICGNLNEDDITHRLTKQERLAQYIGDTHYDLENSFIIGDSHEEPFVARALNIKSISLNGGYVSQSRLQNADPDHHIDELDQLMACL